MPQENLYIFANQDKIDFFYFLAKTYLTELSFFEKWVVSIFCSSSRLSEYPVNVGYA